MTSNLLFRTLVVFQSFPSVGWLIASFIVAMGATGCGSSATVAAGAISVAGPGAPNGTQISALSVGGTATVSMLPSHDSLNAGVDWSVLCGGSPLTGSITGTACGSYSPAHTSDGGASTYTAPALAPVGGTVTLTARVTSDPSASSSITLPIVPLPITVAFVNPPTTVQAGGSVSFAVNALNDSSGAGVTLALSCGSTAANACGAFSSLAANNTTGIYNAPSVVPTGGTVTITATSVTLASQTASITLTIEPSAAAGSVAVSVVPASFYVATVGQGHTFRIAASVAGDPLGAGVTWSVTCGSTDCGSTPLPSQSGQSVTYRGPTTVPAGGGIVSVTATSVADTSKSASSTATVITTSPILINFTAPPPATLPESASADLSASASTAGQQIVWSATCGTAGACGVFTPATTPSGTLTTYTAPAAVPAGGVVTISAASAAATPSNAAYANTTITPPAPAITLIQQPPAALPTLAQAPVSASVSNDSIPGGVTWSLSCGSTVPGGCGSISPLLTADGGVTTYTAPPVAPTGGVTINAASVAFPQIAVSSAPVTINASTEVGVAFVPFAPSQLAGYAVVNLNAAASKDGTNAGVDWQVCGSGCGFFTTVAAVPEIPATATTPFVPAVAAVTATTVAAWPNGLPISYTAPVASAETPTVTITASSHASPAAVITATVSVTELSTGPPLHGLVEVGTQPLAGAAVALYAAGSSGYASASTQLYGPGGASYAVTDAAGSFTLGGGYSCPSVNSQVYLVASGGKTGQGQANPNAAMMTALGPCSNLTSNPLVINEVTTVGSVWPLAQFAANNPLTGQSSSFNIGSTASNIQGLASAFASVNNLVDVSTGKPRYSVPAGNAAVPYVEINTLADVLNSCTSTSGGVYQDGTPCGVLFMLTAPLGSGGPYNGTVPSNTLQAAFNIAQHPDGGLGYGFTPAYLYAAVSAASPFQPVLDAAPVDWSLSLNYTGGSGLNPVSAANHFALDGLNNLWLTDTAGSRVLEWNNQGVPLSPPQGFAAGAIVSPGPLAIDSLNNVWISGVNGLTELYARGVPVQGSPFKNGGGGIGLAIDRLSNVWITDGTGVSEFDLDGTELSPVGGYVNAGAPSPGAITIDDSNNILIGNVPSSNSAYALADLSEVSGQLVANTIIGGDFDLSQQQIAADGGGTVWIPAGPNAGSLCKVPPYGGLGTQQVSTCYSAGPGSLNSLYSPQGVAIDGGGAVWFANAGGAGIEPNVAEILPSQGPATYAALTSQSLTAGPLMLAVDGSGNIWVLLADGTVTEYLGVAKPAVTPLALAVKTSHIGKTP